MSDILSAPILSVRDLRKAEIGNVYDVRVPQAAGGPRLAPKPLDKLRAFHELRGNDLDRDGPFGSHVRSKVNRAHAAATKFALDLVFLVEHLPDKVQIIHLQVGPDWKT